MKILIISHYHLSKKQTILSDKGGVVLNNEDIIFPCLQRCGEHKACDKKSECKQYQAALSLLRENIISKIKKDRKDGFLHD